ncbi:MAG: aminoacyl-tRNA hydrolase [Sedimentisphaerales bacterium]|nr:aminoacyl-tRNA hydrolase [Sedimentisphaerales bacterium]
MAVSDMMKMVVGLGNPGSEYTDTRHNIGFKVIDLMSEMLGVKINKRKFGARFAQAEFADKKLILLKPWRFMNQSGQAVATAVGFYKLALSGLLVVTDDMALKPGRILLRAKGSAGGHNGLVDIIEKLGSGSFHRCRIGIGRNGGNIAYDYVLGEPAESEMPVLNEAIEKAAHAVLCWIEYGIEQAMNEFNS